MFLSSITRLFLVGALTVSSTLGAAIEKRAELAQNGGSASIQWSDSTGNHLRTYHIRSDCKIVENSYNEGSSAWVPNVLPFCANPHWNIVATYVRGGFNQLPEQIQLFWTDNKSGNMASGWWRQDTSWRNDNEFNAMKANAIPGAAVGFRPSPGFVGHMRLYASKYDLVDVLDDLWVDVSHVHEYSWIQGVGWSATNGGKELFWSNTDMRRSGITAVSTDDGSLIRLFYWGDKNSKLANQQYIKQATWTQSVGWKQWGSPHSDLEGFHHGRSVVAVRWGDNTPAGVQIRLYVRWNQWSDKQKYAEYVFSDNKWNAGKELPAYTLDRLTGGNPSAVAWISPSDQKTHIRLYNSRTHASGDRPYVHEVEFNTGSGWTDSSNLPA